MAMTPPLARADLLDVRDDFIINAVVAGQDDHRHVLVDQGDGAVFHLGRRVALGVDVGNFLEFEGAFEGDRKLSPRPK